MHPRVVYHGSAYPPTDSVAADLPPTRIDLDVFMSRDLLKLLIIPPLAMESKLSEMSSQQSGSSSNNLVDGPL